MITASYLTPFDTVKAFDLLLSKLTHFSCNVYQDVKKQITVLREYRHLSLIYLKQNFMTHPSMSFPSRKQPNTEEQLLIDM